MVHRKKPDDSFRTPFERLRAQRDASLKRQLDPPGIEQVLKRVDAVNRRSGFLAWDPAKMALDPSGDPGPAYPRLRPPTPKSPRLFISYGWAPDDVHRTFESDLWVDALAGFLFGRGYDIFFDRDPRNFQKGLNWFQVLTRLNDCNYFVPILTESYLQRVSSPDGAGPLVAEWNHARKLFPTFLTFIGIWRSGAPLLAPLGAENTIDVRSTDHVAAWSEPIAAMFPPAVDGKRGVPRLPAPARPPDPPHWPKFQPY